MKRFLRRAAIGVVLIGTIAGTTGCMTTPEGGEIVVIRNGGPFDNHNIRQIVCPGSGNTGTGVNSTEHPYPASDSQRTYKFSRDKDADAPPIEGLRTADGVKVTLSGTFYLKTRFDCTPQGQKLVKAFDQAFVNRPEGQRPWEDWSGWLNSTVKPILDSNARDVLLNIQCKEVVSSCALLARDTDALAKGSDAQIDVDNQDNVARIEKAMADGLVEQLRNKIGGPEHLDFFQEVTFNMEQPQLPEVEDAIASAQKAYAKVADVRAERLRQQEQVKVEAQKRQVAAQKQKGYAKCPSCARQDELAAFGRNLPHGLTTLVVGDKSVPVAVK